MGLDMFLYRGDKVAVEEWINLLNNEEDEDNIDYINGNPWTEVAYWRKANQIRKWFCDNCGYPEYDSLDEVLITKDDLEKLIDICKKVLNDISLAEKLLPTSRGFFFGSTEYNEWYIDQLESTIKQCEEVIKTTNWQTQIVKYTDWW